MDVGVSRAPGSSRASSCETPMSLGLPVPLPGARHGGVLKCLMEGLNSTAFSDAIKQMQEKAKKKQQEEKESPYPADNEDDPDWM